MANEFSQFQEKIRRLKYCLLLHIDLLSINHDSNLKLLGQILTRAKRLDIINLYTSPKEWLQGIFDRLNTDNEPSIRAVFTALSGKLNSYFPGLMGPSVMMNCTHFRH